MRPFDLRKRKAGADLPGPLVSQLVQALHRFGDSGMGYVLGMTEGYDQFDDEASRSVPVVGACQDLLANSIAGLPIRVHAADGRQVRGWTERMLNTRWMQGETAYRAKRRLMQNVLRYGAGFVYPLRTEDGAVAGLEVLDTRKMGMVFAPVTFSDRGALDVEKLYQYNGNGVTATFHAWQIGAVFFSEHPDGVTKWREPMREIWDTIRAGIGVTRFSGDFYFRGAQPTVIFVMENAPNVRAAQEAQVDITKALNVMLADNRRGLAVPGGVDVKVVPQSGEHSQTVEQRKFVVEEVCRRYDVPTQMVHRSDAGQTQAYEQQALRLVRITLRRWCEEVETALSNLLWPSGKYRCEFDREALTRGDFLGQVAGYTRLVQSGVMTPNEARARFGLAASEDDGADELWVQGAMEQLAMQARQLGGEGKTAQGVGPGMDDASLLDSEAAGKPKDDEAAGRTLPSGEGS